MIVLLGYGLCLILMFFSVKDSVVNGLDEDDSGIEHIIDKLVYFFSIFITFLIMIINIDNIYGKAISIMNKYSNINNLNKVVVLAIVFFLLHFIIYKILYILSEPCVKIYELILYRIKTFNVIFSAGIGLFKGLIIILIIFLGVITFNTNFVGSNKIDIFDKITAYNRLEKIIAVNKPLVYHDDTGKNIPRTSNMIIYYNGVTLEEGVKSSSNIDNKARDIVSGLNNDREKAKAIYSWIGSNIQYDYEKANKVLESNKVKNSGAIEAWNTRKGICFDYACLYVAMCREVNLKVRLITGTAYDGKEKMPHAWNQVYLKDENKWINVDSTFYLAGNNFDNVNFDMEHMAENIAGEW